MKKTKKDMRWNISVALMAAVIVVLASTPLGMIQLPVIKATTVHIPVILGAVLFGPAAGAILGAVFGLCSLASNTTAPTLLSFAFSPFMSTTGLAGVFKALWISLGCRILLGVFAGWLWRGLSMFHVKHGIALPITGFLASLIHTVLVMCSIYLLLAQQYAAAKSVGAEMVWGLIMATIFGSGIPEAIAAAVITGLLGSILIKAHRQLG